MHFFYSQTDTDATGAKPLEEFPFINDFGFEEYKDIRQKPLRLHYNQGIEFCYVTKGRYEWVVGDQNYLLFPGNGFVTCPWQLHGSPREVVDLGEIFWIVIKPDRFTPEGDFFLSPWSRFSPEDNRRIGEVLSKNPNHILLKAQIYKGLFEDLRNEMETRRMGYFQRVCNLVEEFIIQTVRLIQSREEELKETYNCFSQLEKLLVQNLSKKWTLKELAALNNLGITTLINMVKHHTGYTPANYLIFLRLERARKLLSETSLSLTSIALDCGFYSSQHFSSTFSKWEGISPSSFRRKNLLIKGLVSGEKNKTPEIR